MREAPATRPAKTLAASPRWAGQYVPPNSQLLYNGGVTAISALQDLAQGMPVKALIDINAYIWGNVVATQAQQFAKSDPLDPNYTQL